MKNYLIFSLISILLSCHNSASYKRTSYIEYNRSLAFELPFYPDYTHSGVIYNETKKSTEFYFANISESNLLLFFDINGKCLDTINIELIQKELEYVAKGSIIHNRQYMGLDDTGEIIILSESGRLSKRFNIDEYFIPTTVDNRFEYSYAQTTYSTQNSKIAIHPMWVSSKNYPYRDSLIPIARNNYKRYLNINKNYTKKTPLAFEIELNQSNEIISKKIFENYHSRVTDSNEFIFSYFEPIFRYKNNDLIASNRFHDSVWVMKSDSLLSSYKINLKLGKNKEFLKHPTIINLEDSTIKYDISTYLDTIENRMILNSYFERILHLDDKNIYLIVQKTPMNISGGDNIDLDFGLESKNIILLDSNFKVLSETILEKGKYRPLSYLTKDGFFISTDNPNKDDYNPNIYTFDLFNIKL